MTTDLDTSLRCNGETMNVENMSHGSVKFHIAERSTLPSHTELPFSNNPPVLGQSLTVATSRYSLLVRRTAVVAVLLAPTSKEQIPELSIALLPASTLSATPRPIRFLLFPMSRGPSAPLEPQTAPPSPAQRPTTALSRPTDQCRFDTVLATLGLPQQLAHAANLAPCTERTDIDTTHERPPRVVDIDKLDDGSTFISPDDQFPDRSHGFEEGLHSRIVDGVGQTEQRDRALAFGVRRVCISSTTSSSRSVVAVVGHVGVWRSGIWCVDEFTRAVLLVGRVACGLVSREADAQQTVSVRSLVQLERRFRFVLGLKSQLRYITCR